MARRVPQKRCDRRETLEIEASGRIHCRQGSTNIFA